MAVRPIDIDTFLNLRETHPVLDVRSPGEYQHAHIPGAHSFPLFDDEERKQVGTAYKQESRELAIKIGLDYFGPKMRALVEQAESISAQSGSRTLLVHCWRGGMRSGALAWLLDIYGFQVHTLIGGYKSFRRWSLAQFEKEYPLQLIGGYTGSGKTDLLEVLKNKKETILDLEGLAHHKGSAFGNIGLPEQPSQEHFENKLALALQKAAAEQTPRIWVEDESQRIGRVNIPGAFWEHMRRSSVYFLDIPFEKRLAYIVQGYGSLDVQRLCDATDRIRKKLGDKNATEAITFLQNGQITEAFDILLSYYDKMYKKSLFNREQAELLIRNIEATAVHEENADLLLKTITP
jgi:tRNA 2-selenouridine synthase